MDAQGFVILAVLAVLAVAGVVLALSNANAGSIRLRDASGNVIDPAELEDDEPLDLPSSTYPPARRPILLWGWTNRFPFRRYVQPPETPDPGRTRSERREAEEHEREP